MWGQTEITSLSDITNNPAGNYIIKADIDASNFSTSIASFTGTLTAQAKADGTFPVITGLKVPIFTTVSGAKISNLMFQSIAVEGSGPVGAICGTANGSTRIYNCGVLPTLTSTGITYDEDGNITGFGSTVSSSASESSPAGNCGSLVGTLAGNARVINCFSYANITGGTTVAGIVGNNTTTSITQSTVGTVGVVVNCMFYGDITGGTTKRPVYGGNMIINNATNGVNPYCYYRANASFDDSYNAIDNYNRSWPADEEYLTRFEYYRSILNSNKRLCTYWVTDKVYGSENAPTDADEALIAKWVLDPTMAPYPILKKWDKYPSIINPNKSQTIDPRLIVKDANGNYNFQTPQWTNRSTAKPYEGKQLGTISVTVNAGSNHAGTGATSVTLTSVVVMDMDTLNHDYCYAKIQLPYYNELFGDPTVQIPDPSAEDYTEKWNNRYGGNYKDYVVTGWDITAANDATGFTGTRTNFVDNWESGYNFADRKCKDKDYAETSGRVFAQGGYYYVPEGVSSISITAHWGKAVYLANNGCYIDRVNITAQNGSRVVGSAFTPAGKVPSTFQNQTVYTAWHTAVSNLEKAKKNGDDLNKTVYDQAVVLLSNFQLKNGNGKVGVDSDHNNSWYPYTIMSIDQDFDNEPDYCFQLQFRTNFDRPPIQPVRFDFLPVIELGMAVRHSEQQNTIGIFIPQGHFEITETSLMRLTQFEYDGASTRVNSPVILNGGNFEQIVVRKGPQNKTLYFILGGHLRMTRFTPGAHTNRGDNAKVRLCAVNAIGGEFPEFYLSGIYRPDITPASVNAQGNPHCYTNGGYFGIMAGAGYDKILGDVTFKIDHSIIDEFYGGGINGSKYIGGSIDVTIDHSLVGKYCGGPKVGPMVEGKTVTTHATGTTFTNYYGGGNGGTSYYREQGYDGNDLAIPEPTATGWTNFCKGTTCAKFEAFNPLNLLNDASPAYDTGTDKKGYHALYEFECFIESNGLGGNPTLRTYTHWAQFGTTSTGNTTNVLKDCIFEKDFYGGGNLANVNGWVKSTLTDCTVKGNVFGGGYSGQIEPFRIHDKSSTVFPEIDKAGVMHNGSLKYIQDGSGDNAKDRYYTWCYKDPDTGKMYPEGVVIPNDAATNQIGKATFTNTVDGKVKWYVLTTVSLKGLGAVSGYTTLTLDGETTVGTVNDSSTGNVYGGGNESSVNGNTTVILKGETKVLGDVFGGGNKALVGGSATVNIEN